MKTNRNIAACLALVVLSALPAAAVTLSTDRLGNVRLAALGTYCTITQPKVVVTASSTADNGFYVQDVDRCAAIRVVPQSGLVKVVPGDRLNLAGPLFTDTNGIKCLRGVTVTKTSGAEIGPLGVSNKRLYSTQPTLTDVFVRTWGKVKFIAGQGDYFYINDGTTELGVRVVLQSLVGSVAQTSIRGQYVSVCGLLGSVADLTTPDNELTPTINVRSVNDITVLSAAPVSPYPLGLTVSNGVLMHNGAPYRGIGVNFFDPFSSVISGSVGTPGMHTMTYRQSFKTLKQLGIKFVRIAGWDYSPRASNGPGNELYQTDKNSYFHKLDDVYRAAEDNNIGMIPTFFWSYWCVPDMVGETCNQWGNANSQTTAFMKQYVQDYIGCYKNSPSLWGYEFMNEYNLEADQATRYTGLPTWTALGEPATRSTADNTASTAEHAADVQWANTVRLYDTDRIVETGNAETLFCAYHLSTSNGTNWANDSQSQFKTMFLGDIPDPINVVSLHCYDAVESRWTSVPIASMLSIIKGYTTKPIFVGEFGAASIQNATPAQDATTSSNFYAILNAIETQGVSIAAVWAYDFPYYGNYDGWNVTPTNARSWQLDAIQAVNGRIQP